MSFKTTDGYLVMVEGNSRHGKEWFLALPWQAKRFVEVMRFGEMKSMGIPNPKDETKPFQENGYQYQFIILNDWGPCYLRNMDTGKEREIKYMELTLSKKPLPVKHTRPKPVKITFL